MALNIKNEEADRLARHLADVTGESLTETVLTALRQRFERVKGHRRVLGLRDEIERMQDRIGALPRKDDRTDEEILEYDDRGLPPRP